MPMSRLAAAVAVLALINGCSHFRQQTANCSCGGQPCEEQFYDDACGDAACGDDAYYDGSGCGNGDCSDCLPPRVAGKYIYHTHLDKIVTKSTAKKCAKRDLKLFDDCGELSDDFKDGYRQAYIDLALSRPACVPALPPKKYWHAWHRSCAGRDAVEQWFDGYRNGLDNGLNSGVSQFNRIVGNPESCCVSAAYVSPYASSQDPSGVVPLDGQTISDLPEDQFAENYAENFAEPQPEQPVQEWPAAQPWQMQPAGYAGEVPAGP